MTGRYVYDVDRPKRLLRVLRCSNRGNAFGVFIQQVYSTLYIRYFTLCNIARNCSHAYSKENRAAFGVLLIFTAIDWKI